jgi:aspartyl-tRNA(Asn)/glutamyl-tRNA(Gln) amidotransferase subunit A
MSWVGLGNPKDGARLNHDSALGTDTGGSVRLPAAYNDIYGFKPSYGLVSRWGVVAYANSLDTVGYMAKNVKTLRLLHHELGSLEAHDEKDPTSLNLATRTRIRKIIGAQKRPRQSIRFGVPTEYNIEELSPIVREVWLETLQRLQAAGNTIHPVSLPSTRQALSAYYVLAPAEASSNLAKYDGVRYGSHPPDATLDTHTQLFAKTRKHGFGEEVRRRILLGAYSLSADAIDNYFMQAQRIRRLVVKDFDAVFAMPNVLTSEEGSSRAEEADTADAETTIDAIICPTAPALAPTLEEVARQAPLDAYAGDVFTVPASLAGLPALSVPVTPSVTTAMPRGVQSVGMQIITQYGDDEACLDYADLISSLA